MSEKSILFSTEMIQSILKLTKTKTRRLNGLKEINENTDQWEFVQFSFTVESRLKAIFRDNESNLKFIKCPWEVGDTLWVRETWTKIYHVDESGYTHYDMSEIYYLADGTPDIEMVDGDGFLLEDSRIKWKPSIHMPRSEARLFLKVTNIRVERLNEITEEDARAEGIVSYWAEPHKDVPPFTGVDLCSTRRKAFSELWDKLYSKRGYGWDLNPWVWVIEFEKIKP